MKSAKEMFGELGYKEVEKTTQAKMSKYQAMLGGVGGFF